MRLNVISSADTFDGGSAPTERVTSRAVRRFSRAEKLMRRSQPRIPQMHCFDAALNGHVSRRVLLADGNRIYSLPKGAADELGRAEARCDRTSAQAAMDRLGIASSQFDVSTPPQAPPIRAISLAIAQRCNLGCTYCYAREGDFGQPAQSMTFDTARRAIDLLLQGTLPGARVHVAFLGGEPLINRDVLRAVTQHAAEAASIRNVGVGFSITTNGTLVNDDDANFFDRFGFAVTISLDGLGADHDRLRPFKSGRGSYDTILSRVTPMLAKQRNMQVSARVTVTPRNLRLHETMNHFLSLGFYSVGFSPMLASPTGREVMDRTSLASMLNELCACGDEFLRHTLAGRRYAFSNIENAMREIHRGTHRPYPCGAGAGYFGLSAEGKLYACHRFVGDSEREFGDVMEGIDRKRQSLWLAGRHVDAQEPCRSCWARYLCGGGCHHEVIHSGRPACDFIRGWLEYCLVVYVTLLDQRPDYFGSSIGANA
jgi:uncharacterized protein